MKLRIPGTYTGHLGPVEFDNGVSVGLVSPNQANQLRAIMAGVEILQDDGETVDEALMAIMPLMPAGYYIDAGLPLPSPYLTQWDGTYPTPPLEVIYCDGVVDTPAPASVVEPPREGEYLRADLERIADEKGIAGLRAIGDPIGVKAQSVVKLIDGILEFQAQKANEKVA